ncbi:MAG: hypothetical protein KBD50_00575 [Candidatus Pacebacteria bacterium]|nr:hypothetical protein [Candidatus Paceibacterota bacterium]
MKVIEEWVGKKWVAGLMLGVMIVTMANGFVVLVHAEGESTESASSESTPAPESSTPPAPTTETTPASTSSEPTPETTPSTPDAQQGGTGEAGQPGATESQTAPQETPDPSTVTDTGTQGQEGQSGANGTTTPAAAPSDGQPAEISTGNATAGAAANTSANTTSVDTASSTTPAPEESTGSGSGGSGDTTVGLTNGLNATTTASTTANTGENTGGDPDGINIFTGEGISSLFDVLTYNIALVNSTGDIMLLQNPLASELDLRQRIQNIFKNLTGESGTCTLTVCEATDAIFNYIGDNIGEVERNTYAGCNSGKNLGESEGGPVLIDAGDCTSSNLTVTIGDLTALHSRYLIILMNQVGDLEGDIVLPEASFFEGLRAGGGIGAGSALAIGNTADATNNGTSTASSGDNTANGTGTSAVDTGNALAHAFTSTFANQINPPSCFIISVGGTWNGDVYQIPEGYDRETTPYADIICGRGKASGDMLENFNIKQTNYAKVLVNAIAEATTGGNVGTGGDVTIKSGDAQSFLYVLNILNTTLIGQDWMFGLFTVSGNWDGDFTFGPRPGAGPSEQAAGQMVGSGGGSSSYWKKAVAESKLQLTKTASQSTVTSPGVIEYTLTLMNNGSNVYGAKLRDTLMNPMGEAAGVQTWNLGTIKAGEEIVIKYSIEFKGSLVPGKYDNTARLTGYETSSNGITIKPVTAKATVELLEGEVLAATDCPAYLSSYIIPGANNDPAQVTLLETFLHDVRGAEIVPDGEYDAASIAAVSSFQKEFASDILSPWGLGDPTGHVYYTTKKKINEINCGGEQEFPLSSLQMNNIMAYRNGTFQPALSSAPITLWSAANFPFFAQYGSFHGLQLGTEAPATTPSLFSKLSLQSFPLVTLLRDIFSSIAFGFSAEHVQAAVK